METAGTTQDPNQKAINELLEKSRMLREEAKATAEKLKEIIKHSDELIHERPNNKSIITK